MAERLPQARPDDAGAYLRVAVLCFLVLFLEGYDVSAMSYATPSLMDAWQLRAPQFTTAVTAGGVGLLLGSVIAGLPGDRRGRKPVLVGCVAMFGLFSLLSAISYGLGSLTLLRFLTCLGIGGGLPLTIALTTDYAPPKTRARVVVLMSVGLSVGSTAGGFFAHQILASHGWQAIFVAGGVLPLVLVPVLLAYLPESHAIEPDAGATRRANPSELFRHGFAIRTTTLWIVNFFQLFGVFLILLWMPAMLHAQGLSPADAIFATTMYPIGSVLGAIVSAPIVDRLGTSGSQPPCCASAPPACFSPAAWHSPTPGSASSSLALASAPADAEHGINAVSGALYPAAIRATGAGWALGIGRVGQIAGPLTGGLLLGLGWEPRDIFLAAAAPTFCVAMGMAALAVLSRRRSQGTVPLNSLNESRP